MKALAVCTLIAIIALIVTVIIKDSQNDGKPQVAQHKSIQSTSTKVFENETHEILRVLDHETQAIIYIHVCREHGEIKSGGISVIGLRDYAGTYNDDGSRK